MESAAEEAELKLNIKKRGICKAKLTSFSNFLSKLVSLSADTTIDSVKLTELDSRLNKLPDIFSEFDTYQTSIELKHENLEEQLAERESFENSYYSLLATGKDILNKNSEKDDRISQVSGDSHSVISNAGMPQSRPKLPAIPIPKFHGDFEKWLEFRDTFSSLIHKNDSVSDIEKFHFLRGSLEGNAKNILQNLEVSAANYPIAWDLLCERFDNKGMLVNNYLKMLLAIPSLGKESSLDLRKLLDGMVKCLRSLEALGVPVDSWDTLVIHLMCNKLDPVTAREWQEQNSKNNLPTLSEFKTFLKSKAELLETLEATSKGNKSFSKDKYSKSFLSSEQECCALCNEQHNITNCKTFLKLSTYNRFEKARHLRLCLNCFKKNHLSKDCNSSGCRKCSLRHHTLLHYEKKSPTQEVLSQQNVINETNVPTQNTDNVDSVGNSGNVTFTMASSNINQTDSLLSTALVQVVDSNGKLQSCRILMDSGSQSNFVTDDLCNRLGLVKEKINVSIVGINQVTSCIKNRCTITFHSNHFTYWKKVSCLVVPKISGCIPSKRIDVSHLNIPGHLKLADPGFAVPGSIDMLLGVDVFYQLLCIGQVNLGPNQPIMQKTRLGWLISGPYSANGSVQTVNYCNLSINSELHNQLEKFWVLEEPPSSLKPILSNDDKECESIFVSNVKRDELGRFVVQIPLKQSPKVLGESSVSAKRQFFALERRLQKNPKMRELYVDFMAEYESMGHMSLDTGHTSTKCSYFMPHHGVLNENSSTTRLRVVFNASAQTDNGMSLNDIQYTGPNIQDDILSILLQFRVHNVVVCADVAKRYRMIMVQEDQRDLQKIYWRASPSDELKVFKLNTVTYGTTSAPFLAIRCLKQLGLDFEEKYPEASNIILHNFFVDDMLFGTDSVDRAVALSTQVASILKSGGFILRKWISNSPEVLEKIIGDDGIPCDRQLVFGDKTENKTLGLYWSFKPDVLRYHISSPSCEKFTKRSILSAIAKIYDPLGLLSVCVILAKIILQKLWSEKVGWDETLPSAIHSSWYKFSQQLEILNNLSIPRKMVCENYERIELHGFCDSSIAAYGACLYLKSVSACGKVNVSLVYGKAKVAPLQVVTLPRLELCGAFVLAQLVHKFKESVSLCISATCLWTDSTVVLGWISQSPHNLHTFVGNRVSQIQTLTHVGDWRHVKSEMNPADMLSRGVYPENLIHCKFWWNGPSWLKLDCSEWPKPIFVIEQELPEIKKNVKTCHMVPSEFPMNHFSSFSRLKRSFAYLWRFYNNCKVKQEFRVTGPLSSKELKTSLERLLVISQKESFAEEYALLVANKPIHKGPLSTLNPFIDSQGVLRVGGRLQLSNLDYAKKHPAVVSCKHIFTKLLFTYEHKVLLHAGPQQLLASVREHYWPIGGRNLAKSIVHRCVICFKVKPKSVTQIMGVLPKDRVTPTPPFHTTGVDYAGPFNLKDKKGRGAKIIKCYVCLFICFSTRAIHLELVSELTSEAFIATFRRFVSRRGKPAFVWSDNGLNFVGANSELNELVRFLQTQSNTFIETLENEGITWKFIPAKSPNFGGIWEAGVKACKFHIKRVMGNASLTFESFYTLLTQIEAILNSRPLVPISPDPSDYDVLTPAHFLIGRRLTALPDVDVKDVPDNRLSKFQYIQKLYQHFWQRWSKEYVILLQQRLKWKHPQRNLQVGELVLIRDDNVPPLSWKLGRVTVLHPGLDKQCRVASVKTTRGIFKRPISKLCPLPNELEDL